MRLFVRQGHLRVDSCSWRRARFYLDVTEGLTTARPRGGSGVRGAGSADPGGGRGRGRQAAVGQGRAGDRAGRVPRRRARGARHRPPPDRDDAGAHTARHQPDQPLPRDGRARPRPSATCSAPATSARSSCATRATSTPRTTPRSAPLEAAIDLLLLDDQVEICVLRGGVVEHPRYAGRRVFGAGLNLTHLYRGQISYLFFPIRDLGLVHKVFRADKLWIAAAETFAIGGGCQLLLCVDHILCERGTRLTLPARNEGIIPGAANLRLPRFVGDRRARQAILSGSELQPEELADEIVEPGEMDAAHRRARRGALQLRSGQRRRQPQGVPRRPGAARRLPRVHVRVLPRAGGLLLQSRSHPQPRGELACPRETRLSGSSSGCAGPRSARASRPTGSGSKTSRSPSRRTCASTTRSAWSPSRTTSCAASTRRRARAASRPSSPTTSTTSTCGRRSWRTA